MKTIKEILIFCNEFAFFDHYNIERVIELNHVRNYIISVLFECFFISNDFCDRVIGGSDEKSLLVKDKCSDILVEKQFILELVFQKPYV